MDGPIIGYIGISDDPLVPPQGAIQTQFAFPLNFFCLILQEFCDFFGIWDLHRFIFIRMQFLQKFWFQQYFWFFGDELGPKMDQNYKLWGVQFEPKCKILRDFSNAMFVLFGGVTAQKPTKRGHFMDAEAIQKTLKIFNVTTTYALLIKLTTNMQHLNKIFQ